jgi:hypothetical protein
MERKYTTKFKIIATILAIGLFCPQALLAEELPLKESLTQPELVSFIEYEKQAELLQEALEIYKDITDDNNTSLSDENNIPANNVVEGIDDDNSGYGIPGEDDGSKEIPPIEPVPPVEEPDKSLTPSIPEDALSGKTAEAQQAYADYINVLINSALKSAIENGDTSELRELLSKLASNEETDIAGLDTQELSKAMEVLINEIGLINKNEVDDSKLSLADMTLRVNEINAIYDILSKTSGITIDEARELLHYKEEMEQVQFTYDYNYNSDGELVKVEVSYSYILDKTKSTLSAIDQKIAEYEGKLSEVSEAIMGSLTVVFSEAKTISTVAMLNSIKNDLALAYGSIENGIASQQLRLYSEDLAQSLSLYNCNAELNENIKTAEGLVRQAVDQVVTLEDTNSFETEKYSITEKGYAISDPANLLSDTNAQGGTTGEAEEAAFYARNIAIEPKEPDKAKEAGNFIGNLTIEYIEDRQEGIAETEITDGESKVLLYAGANHADLNLVGNGSNGSRNRAPLLNNSPLLDPIINGIYDEFQHIKSASQPLIDSGFPKFASVANSRSNFSNSYLSNFYDLTSQLLTALNNPQYNNFTKEPNARDNKEPYSFDKVLEKSKTYSGVEKITNSKEDIIRIFKEEIRALLSERELATDTLTAPYDEKFISLLAKAQWLWEKQGIDPNLYLARAGGADESKTEIKRAITDLNENIPNEADLIALIEKIAEMQKRLKDGNTEGMEGVTKEAWDELFGKEIKKLIQSGQSGSFTDLLFGIYNKETSGLVLQLFANLVQISKERIKDVNTLKEITAVIQSQIYELVHVRNVAMNVFYSDIAPYYRKMLSVLKETGLAKDAGLENIEDVINNEDARAAVEKLIAYVYKNNDKAEAKNIIELEKKLRIEYVEPALQSFREKIKEASREFYTVVEKKADMLAGPSINDVNGELEVVIVLPKSTD